MLVIRRGTDNSFSLLIEDLSFRHNFGFVTENQLLLVGVVEMAVGMGVCRWGYGTWQSWLHCPALADCPASFSSHGF